MKNPFPVPDKTSEENKLVLAWVNDMLAKGGLRFYDCMEKLEDAIKSNNKSLATIIAYYIANIVTNSNEIRNIDKPIVIRDIKKSLDSMNKVS